jgi:endonuclease YncB( thermonuclease family)
MFHTLRRFVVVSGWIGLAALALYLYQFRHALDPVVDLVRSLSAGEGVKQEGRGELSGRAVRVFSGDTFQLRDAAGRVFTVRLTGLSAPDPNSPNAAERLRAGQSRTNLSELVLSNQVRVTVTLSNEASIVLGLVRVGTTHVNARMVQSRAAVARRDLMRGLPLKDRYALIHADRLAQNAAKREDARVEDP